MAAAGEKFAEEGGGCCGMECGGRSKRITRSGVRDPAPPASCVLLCGDWLHPPQPACYRRLQHARTWHTPAPDLPPSPTDNSIGPYAQLARSDNGPFFSIVVVASGRVASRIPHCVPHLPPARPCRGPVRPGPLRQSVECLFLRRRAAPRHTVAAAATSLLLSVLVRAVALALAVVPVSQWYKW